MLQTLCETFLCYLLTCAVLSGKTTFPVCAVGDVLKLNNLSRLFHLHEILRKVTRLYVKFDSIQHIKST